MGWIVLSNGLPFDFTERTMGNVTPEVVAHSLAMQCRYGGHCPRFYSVAEHSLHMARHYPGRPGLAFAALMHDAHESVVQGIVRPSKTGEYRAFEDKLAALFERRFGYSVCDEVKRMDNAMLAAEAVLFYGPGVLGEWDLPEPPISEPWRGPTGMRPEQYEPWLAAYHELNEARKENQ